jgi:hypothetical protein
MNFKDRLRSASQRGQQARDSKVRQETAEQLSKEESRRVHTGLRLELSEHIEYCLQQLADNIPGFRFETIANDKGWGASVSRDDLSLNRRKRESFYSRYVLLVSPFSKYQVLDLVAKGTIRNKDNFHRHHYQLLKDVDMESFREMVELWTLDYAEGYAASG